MSTSHVLVVDDEGDIRALIDEILSDEGYNVTVAADASEARAAREQEKFDLVLLDIWMPDTDGISLLREWSEPGDLDCPVATVGASELTPDYDSVLLTCKAYDLGTAIEAIAPGLADGGRKASFLGRDGRPQRWRTRP